MTSTVLSWAFECYEKGLISSKDTDGLELKWGDPDAMLKMQEKLAYRDVITSYSIHYTKLYDEARGGGAVDHDHADASLAIEAVLDGHGGGGPAPRGAF